MRKQLTKAGYGLLLTVTILLIVFSVGITYAAFHSYNAASSSVHTINKLGQVQVTTTSTEKVYPGTTVNGAFQITNAVASGYGTLSIVVDSIAVSKIEAIVPGVANPVELTTGAGGVVSYSLGSDGIAGQTIASGQTKNVSFSMTFSESATYAEASSTTLAIDTPDYLVNKTVKIVVTFTLNIKQYVPE